MIKTSDFIIRKSTLHLVFVAAADRFIMEKQSVQVFGRKKTATAVAFCTKGRGLIKVNGVPIELLEPGE
jgi:hypothetical protein